MNELGKVNVVEADEGHIVGNAEAALLKCAESSDGGHVVGAEDGRGWMRETQQSRHSVHAAFELMIAFEDEVFAGDAAASLHGGEKGMTAQKGGVFFERAGDEADVTVSERYKMLEGFEHALAVVDEQDVLRELGVGDVDEDHGDVSVRKLVEDGIFDAEGHDRDAVDVALDHAPEAVLELGVVVGGADEEFVAVLDGGTLKALDELGEKRVGDVGDKEADETGATGDEGACLGVWEVVEIADGLVDASGKHRVHGGDLIDGARNSRDRDTGSFGDIADVEAFGRSYGAGERTSWLSRHRSGSFPLHATHLVVVCSCLHQTEGGDSLWARETVTSRVGAYAGSATTLVLQLGTALRHMRRAGSHG